MIIPNIWENKKWQPNHQPDEGFTWRIQSLMAHMIACQIPNIMIMMTTMITNYSSKNHDSDPIINSIKD